MNHPSPLNAKLICSIVVLTATSAFAQFHKSAGGLLVRDGYELVIAVDELDNARYLECDDEGSLYVARMRNGDIFKYADTDGDGDFDKATRFVDGRVGVSSLQFVDGWLWYGTADAVRKARDTNGDGVGDEEVDVLPPGSLPTGKGHNWRPVLLTNDTLYTSIGDEGNISIQADSERQKIWAFDLDGSNKRLFATGIRNTEKLRLRPGTDEIWGFDHGSDWFGRQIGDERGNQPITDLNPPDELNHYVQDGFYGHPYITGNRLPRYEYLELENIHELAAKTIPPEWLVGAHWACNGFTFIDPKINNATGAFPADHNGDIFVASHGSWNSTNKVGYTVARVLFDEGHPYGLLKIVSTVAQDGTTVLGRPVDCVQAPDGSIFFSCDYKGRVYRLRAVPEPVSE